MERGTRRTAGELLRLSLLRQPLLQQSGRRRALLRRRPDVTSWRELLERARDRYERQGIDELVASA